MVGTWQKKNERKETLRNLDQTCSKLGPLILIVSTSSVKVFGSPIRRDSLMWGYGIPRSLKWGHLNLPRQIHLFKKHRSYSVSPYSLVSLASISQKSLKQPECVNQSGSVSTLGAPRNSLINIYIYISEFQCQSCPKDFGKTPSFWHHQVLQGNMNTKSALKRGISQNDSNTRVMTDVHPKNRMKYCWWMKSC